MEEIPYEIDFYSGEDSASFNVNPVYDGIIEGEESLIFIVENTLGCIARYDTVICYIQNYIEMYLNTSPNTMICDGQELDLWVQAYNGFPPYTYLWEPGGYTEDTITVSPEENTTYVVTITDFFEEGGFWYLVMEHVDPHQRIGGVDKGGLQRVTAGDVAIRQAGVVELLHGTPKIGKVAR